MMIQMVTKVITVVKPSIKVKRLDEEGMLEERLLRYLWKHELEEDPHRFEIFTEEMKTFGLLFEKSEVPESNRVFLVPSRMQTKKESLEVKTDEENMVSIYLTPTDFLPNAVYNTLVVAFLDLMEVKGRPGEPVVFQNRSEFDFKDHGVNLGTVKIENRHALKLEISHLIKVDGNTTGPKNEPHRSFCIEVLGYLKHQLQNVLVTSETVGYNLCVLCTACNPAEKPHLHGLKRCLEQDFDGVKCGDKLMDTTRLKSLFSEDTPDATTTPLAISSSLPSGQLIDTPDDTTTPLAISSSLSSGQLIDTPDDTTTPVAIISSLSSGQLIDTPDDTTTPVAIISSLSSGQLIDTPDDTTTPVAIISSLSSDTLTTTPLATSSLRTDTQTATPLSTSSLETDAPIAAPLAASSLGTGIETSPNSLEDKLNKLNYDLSEVFMKNTRKFLFLRCCLFDEVDLQVLGNKDYKANDYFNELTDKGKIKPTDINLLLEVATLSEIKHAKDLVTQYMNDNNVQISNQQKLSPYRKRLCKALEQFNPSELNRVTACYQLEQPTIWDVTFYLESKSKLVDESEREKFAELLGPIPKKIMCKSI
ncbi:uncharacterized protein [Antedon mediterranea]|uniref:uncharacterized protein n=1 Tax=Antedon mediterranea TaxID=105859 RepID=UPI003AF7B97F